MSFLAQLPLSLLTSLRAHLGRLTDPSTPLLPFIPKPLKLILLILIVFNSPSFAFTWHYRVWYWPLKAYYEVYTKGRKKYLDDFEKVAHASGGVKMRTRMKRIAWVDDCDYNLHLSNSCYAKNADAARMEWCIKALAPVFTPDCHMAMGASHYVFIKEIPIGSEYVMESHAGAWGEKWMYLVTEFIIYPKKGSRSASKGKGKAVTPDFAPTGPVVPSISASVSGDSTPNPLTSGESTPPVSLDEVKRSAALRSRAPREDGGIVCALVVSEYCFKVGRVTVPPRIALHIAMLSEDQSKRDHVRNLLLNTKDRGNKWMKGGWKEDDNAAEIGLDIGRSKDEGHDGEAAWVTKGRVGMERVVEGLGVF